MNRRSLIKIVVASAASTIVFAAEGPQDRIPIFVKSGGDAAGFTDPSKARQDSVKDLLKKLKNSKSVCPVDSEKDALAVIEVLDRATSREVRFLSAQNKSYLTVRLTAGEYSVEFAGEAAGGNYTAYSAAAAKVVKQLDAWVKANHDRLLASKK
jgi:hypothetical protein